MLRTLFEFGPIIFVAALVIYENFQPLVLVVAAVVTFVVILKKVG